MKRILFFLIIALLFTACSPAPAADLAPAAAVENASPDQPAEAQDAPSATATPAPDSAAPAEGTFLSTEFADAANLRSQLAYGTLQLEGTAQAVSPEQARALLPLWQAVVALSGTATTVSEELTAVQDQIAAAMQPAQLQAIAGLAITNAALTEFYASRGVVFPTPVPGVTRVPGANKNLSEEDRQATRTAKEDSGIESTGAGQASKTLLYEEVIKLLTERAAQ